MIWNVFRTIETNTYHCPFIIRYGISAGYEKLNIFYGILMQPQHLNRLSQSTVRGTYLFMCYKINIYDSNKLEGMRQYIIGWLLSRSVWASVLSVPQTYVPHTNSQRKPFHLMIALQSDLVPSFVLVLVAVIDSTGISLSIWDSR